MSAPDELEKWREIEAVLERRPGAGDADLESTESESSESVSSTSESTASESSDSRRVSSPSRLPLDQPIDAVFGGLLDGAIGALGGEPAVAGLGPGDEVGVYRLEEVIGEGGMGTVFQARRADGSFEQVVALKVLHRGPADEGARRRFLQERQILAGLRHPHIARLLDGGVVGTVPYLVMEFVDGPPITHFSRTESLGREQRLRLFLQVCGAVRYAHREGVIHRDLKPSNLLVEQGPASEPRVAVLDFGIARVEGQAAAVTATGQVFGTPGYMSPEQARGRAGEIDRRSDIFSLGAVLYELLSDRRPFEGESAAEILGQVMTATTVPVRRRLPGISPDLETIIETCLRRDPAKRYDSVRALAEDVESYLDGRPIAARPLASLERWRRRARRRPKTAAFIAGALGVSLASLAALVTMAMRHTENLRSERNAAVEARQDAEELLDFMLQDLHDGLDRVGRLDLLEQVARKSLDYHGRRPVGDSNADVLRRATALSNSGEILENQGDYEAALGAFRENLEMFERLAQRETNPRWRLEQARNHQAMASVLSAGGETARALEHASRGSAITRQLEVEGWTPEIWSEVHLRCLLLQGWTLRESGAVAEAIETLDEVRRIAAGQAARHPSEGTWRHLHGAALVYLGTTHEQAGDLDSALRRYIEARTVCEELVRRDPKDTTWREELQLALGRLGAAQADSGDLEGATETLLEASRQAEILVRLEPGNAGWVRELSVAYSALSYVRREVGDSSAALGFLEKSLEISRRRMEAAPQNPTVANDLAWDLLDLGYLQNDLGEKKKAEAAWRESVDVMRAGRALGANSGHDLDVEFQALLALGSLEEARPLARQLHEMGWKSPDFLALAAEHGLAGVGVS